MKAKPGFRKLVVVFFKIRKREEMKNSEERNI